MLNKKDLKESGWTEAGIKRFLGEPDETQPNPMYRSAAPMLLYARTRVRAVERTRAYLAWKAESEKRKDVARSAVISKKASLCAAVERWAPNIPVLELAELRRKAIESYNGDDHGEARRFDRAGRDRWRRRAGVCVPSVVASASWC